MKKRNKLILGVIIAVIVLIVAYFIFWYTPTCGDGQCFDSHLQKCSRADFISYSNMTFEYKILGRSSAGCDINVKLLRGDLSNQDSIALQGKEMVCSTPYGAVVSPEGDISLCHGILKEGLQDLIISKLHRYIVQNLGKINAGV